ncbi:DinB family protein [Urechidicola croceus]|uniref:DinB-like domain-containing protein n=1 Tax=Urechidicola croceus TaxID=1850246 RepID=A0A1D8PA68_9FLAO|nr:DinB family protein [Urechidicola croceus]AOW21411.1 hypothetical protein LPB138_12300 [Urechidicola croceus]
MRKLINCFAIIILFVSASSCKNVTKENNSSKTVAETNNEFSTSFVKVLENAKAYTLEVAEAMPAEDYNYKTSDSVRTFGEQLTHIGTSTQFILSQFIKGETPPKSVKTEEEISTSKDEVIQLLTDSFDETISTLKKMNSDDLSETFILDFVPEKPKYTKKEGFAFLRDHITHHRGQAIIYLRDKGHKAPLYRAF